MSNISVITCVMSSSFSPWFNENDKIVSNKDHNEKSFLLFFYIVIKVIYQQQLHACIFSCSSSSERTFLSLSLCCCDFEKLHSSFSFLFFPSRNICMFPSSAVEEEGTKRSPATICQTEVLSFGLVLVLKGIEHCSYSSNS